MSRKTINVIIGIVLAFIVVFFAGSFAYEQFVKDYSDSRYENNLDDDLNNKQEENKSGETTDESKTN